MRTQTREDSDCCCPSVADGASALHLCSLEGWVTQSPAPGLGSTPAHWAIQDYAEDTHLFPIYLRARPCLSCQPTKLPGLCSQPVFLHQLLTAARYFPLLSSLCSKPTLPPGEQGAVLAAAPTRVASWGSAFLW